MTRRRRTKRAVTTAGSNAAHKETVLKRSNSASTLLGLSIVLKSDFLEYSKNATVSQNDFFGFRVKAERAIC